MTERHVIVGAGQAAAQAAFTLRQVGHAGPITLIGDEAALPYQRPPLSKKFLLGEVDTGRLLLRPEAYYHEADVDLRLAVQAVRIDRAARRVELSDGSISEYDKLLLATGSRARRLPHDLPGVHYLRSAADAAELRCALLASRRLVVVGGGYIGLEVAAIARQMGLEVDVIEAAPRVLARVAGAAVSEFFSNLHHGHGVHIHVGAMLDHIIDRDGRAGGVRLFDGVDIPADLVVAGIGTIPNVELATEAGLEVNNGISVDALCRTSDPMIFAAGDCTSHPSVLYGRRLRLESVQNAIEQAKSAAASMCGVEQPYHQVPWFWSDQYDVKFQAAGLPEFPDETRVDQSTRGFSVSYLQGGRLIAIEAVNAPAAFMAARQTMSKHLAETTLPQAPA